MGINGAVAGPCVGIAWGAPVAGRLGLEGDAKSSTTPKRMTALDGLKVLRVACRYGHVSMVATNEEIDVEEAVKGAPVDMLASFPVLTALPVKAAAAGKKKADSSAAKPATKKAKK